MILADKIIEQRKKLGLSQEELADRLGISRQAVSKWEGAQSTPDLARILALSQLFGVSTDYLLKDTVELAEYVEAPDNEEPMRRVSMAEANEFLAVKEVNAGKISWGVFLCIISPICLLLLAAASDTGLWGISENAAGAIGMVTLLLIVASAVAIFISSGMKEQPYEYLQHEVFDTEYGVVGMVKERRSRYQSTYTRKIIVGICTCILSPVPLLAAVFSSGRDFLQIAMICLLLLMAAIGVQQIVSTAVRWESMRQLLQEGDYSKKQKKRSGLMDAISGGYWMLVVAAYLAYSFLTSNWQKSWIIWPVAAVLFGAIAAISSALANKSNN